MSNTTDENDGFEEWLMDAARDYNAPPAETPREAMWARIAAARKPAEAAPPVTAAPTRLGRAGWMRRGLAAAAVLLVGIAIGRGSNGVVGPAPTNAGSTTTAAETAQAPASAPPTTGGVEPLPTPFAGQIVKGNGQTRLPSRRDGGQPAAPRSGVDAPNGVSGSAGAFQLATVQHLAQAEALLTTFRVDERAGRTADARQLAASARDLLSTTRLLADSPAADDPQVRRLLEDLELVLAQIALLSQERSASDRQLIDHALDERAVMPRLRTAIPAGRLSAGT